MRRFIIEVFVFVLLLFLTAWLIYGIKKPWQQRYLEGIKKNVQIVNLGTSHGWDIDYAKTKLKGVNFNTAANTLYYDLQNYRFLYREGYLSEDAIIIIPVSYFVFGLEENRADRLPDDSFVNQFYYYLPPWDIYSFSITKEVDLHINVVQQNFDTLVFGDKEKVRFSKQDEKKINSTKSKSSILEKKVAEETKEPQSKTTHIGVKKEKKGEPVQKFENIDAAFKSDRKVDSIAMHNEIIQKLYNHAEKAANHHLKLSQFTVEDRNVKYLELLIKEILDNNQQVVLLTTPYFDAYNKQFGKDWLVKNYYPKLHKMSLEFNVPYLDYSHDERFTYSPEYYENSDHLNRKGRKAFSGVFFKDLEKVLKRDDINW